MQREHAIEPLSGIARAGPYPRRTGSSRHLNTLAGLGSWAFSPRIGSVGIHVFGPADRKGRSNQGYLDGSGELSRHAATLYAYLTLFAERMFCVVLGIDEST
jgi:hypothetical protein